MDSFTRQKYSTRFRDASKTDTSTAKGPPVRPVTSRTWQASMQHPPPSPAPDSSVAVYTNELYSSKGPLPAGSNAGSMHPTYSPLSARRPATSTRRPATGSAPPPPSRNAGDPGASARATVRRAPATARGPFPPSTAEHLPAPGGASAARYDAPPLSAHASVASQASAREIFGKTAPQSVAMAEAAPGMKPAPSSSAPAQALPTTRASLRPATAAAGTLDAASAKGSILAAAAAARPATSGLISARRPTATAGGGVEMAEAELGPAQAALAAAAMAGRTNILRQLLFQPSPQNRPFFCRLQRKRAGIFRSHCVYHLSLEQGTVPLLFALRKKSKAGAIKYLISTQADDFAAASPCRMGKLVANFLGTEFVLQLPASTRSAPPTELASIAFQSNGIGSKGPRKIHVTVPSMDAIANAMGADASKAAVAARLSSLPSLGAAKLKDKGSRELTVLKNKPPRWNDSLQAYCLNFNGRVTQASVKNFQLASDADPDTTVLQFGRVAADAFTMDCIYPLSILQAFAICLTSFESKLTCE